MPSALPLRTDYSSADLRRLAKKTKDNNQSRRLLSLAAVLDGMNRTDAARIGGMDRQTLRDWVHRFNDQGPDGLCDVHAGGVEPRLSPEKLAELAAIVEAGPDREKDGVVRWRRVDLQRVVKERFGTTPICSKPPMRRRAVRRRKPRSWQSSRRSAVRSSQKRQS